MTIETASEEINTFMYYLTYQTDSFAKSRVCRKRIQDMDYTLERFHHFAFDSSKFIEGPCLILKDFGDEIGRRTLFELLGERMVNQFLPSLRFISLQGSLEERLKRRATSRRATHITGRKNWLL
jgi:hypothetical protein